MSSLFSRCTYSVYMGMLVEPTTEATPAPGVEKRVVMSVMSAARIPVQPTSQLPVEVNLSDLPTAVRDRFLDLMDQVDSTISVPEILLLNADAASIIGLRLPPRGEIAVCSCGCNCLIVFDLDQAHEYDDGYGRTLQCPGCADDHRGRDAE